MAANGAPDPDRLTPIDLATLRAAFETAANAPSMTGRGLAIPAARDLEMIWHAIAASVSGDRTADGERGRAGDQ